jgi:glucose-6-phosphate 1-dehydrogenase
MTLDRLVETRFAEGAELEAAQPTSFALFGATGDLARRKLLPALYNLAYDGVLPRDFFLCGIARTVMSDEEFRALAEQAVRQFSRREPEEQILDALLDNARYIGGSFDDPGIYTVLRDLLDSFDAQADVPLNRCFYLSTAPDFFPVIVEQLGRHGLQRRPGAAVRILIEKPFGTTLAGARALNQKVLSVFDEEQVFRIDHYLGKETVQNLMALRFANMMFEPTWNRNHIEHVQITAAEDVGVGGRASYYDTTGALRDLIQNHLLQMLCLVAMEPPVDFSADEVRDEKVKVLRAIKRPRGLDEVADMAVRAQYGPGVVGGEPVPGYLQEEGVPPGSTTETYAAVRLEVDNWRWAGVPFYVRTGKRLPRKLTEIAVELKRVPHLAFAPDGSVGVQPNRLILTVHPDEGVSLSLAAKIPGATMRIRPVLMQFLYGASFLTQSVEAYERLIIDALRGDATLFTRNDEVEAQWRICDPIVQAWKTLPGPLPQYPAGSQGPAEADALLRPGHAWRRI